MKPELTKEVVLGASQPSLVRARRLSRKVMGLLPDSIYRTMNELSPEVRQIPMNNKDQALELAHGLRRRIDPGVLAKGVYIEPGVEPYKVRAYATSHDTTESEVTEADLEVFSTGGRHTWFKVHVDEPKDELAYRDLIPVDASFLVHGTDREKLFGDEDFHPVERQSVRETIQTVVGEIVTARELHVFREYPVDSQKLL